MVAHRTTLFYDGGGGGGGMTYVVCVLFTQNWSVVSVISNYTLVRRL